MIERERRVQELFERALGAPDPQKTLEEAGDLRPQVERLLESHARMGDFLAVPPPHGWPKPSRKRGPWSVSTS
ncbi:MAG: hypothetical protein HC813_01780, partial [Planctomycetes bacterium]|nr:hypothetical protein [Planctomycetota bacterium]